MVAIYHFPFFLLSLLFFIGSGHPSTAQGQKDIILRAEKINSAKTVKFRVGDRLRYKTRDLSGWQWGVIERLDFIQQMVIFDRGPERIEDLTSIQTEKQYGLATSVRNFLVAPGVTLILAGGILALIGDGSEAVFGLVVGGALTGTGLLANWILQQRQLNLKKRWRLRILDLSID